MGVGAGVAAMGVGMLTVAAGATGALVSLAKASTDYTKEASLTLTQVDEQYGATLEQVKAIGKNVAKEIPAPFKEMQKSLFDIFSSIDVNVQQAEGMLKNFAKGAVAGQTDVQTAGRASIAIMNGFKIPVEEVTRVMDVQFQAVRKGVFTYEEFASTIGRAIPSAAKAGGTIEDLSGMMAFMTRNGLSSAMAATSAARAFDLLSNPKFGQAMKDFGINVADAKGNFRPMVDVVVDLRKKLASMSEEARANKLKELTLGAGGTIQAMRFLNLGVQDVNGLLPELTAAMSEAGGATERAYEIMSNTPSAKIELLKNRWQVFRTELGDRVMPIVGKLSEIGTKVVDWLLKLSPATQDMIVKSLLFTVVIAGLGGAFLVLVGFAMILAGAFVAIGIPIWAIIAAFIALGAILGSVWGWFKMTGDQGDDLRIRISDAFRTIKEIVNQVIKDVREYLEKNDWDKKIKKFVEEAKATLTDLWTYIQVILEFIQRLWQAHGDDIIRIVGGFFDVMMGIVRTIMAVFRGDWSAAWDGIKQIFAGFSDAFHALLRIALKGMVDMFAAAIMSVLDLTLKLPFLPESVKRAIDKSKEYVESFRDKAHEVIDQINAKEIKPKEPDTAAAIASFRAMERDLTLTIDRINAKEIKPRVSGAITQIGNVRVMAAGGIVKSPTFALIAEAGPEVVLPLNNPRRMQQLMEESGMFKRMGNDGAFAGSFSGAGSGAQLAPTTSNLTLRVEAGAIQISGVSEPERVGDIVDEKLRNLIAELRARNG